MTYRIDTWDLEGSIPIQRAIPGTDNVCRHQGGIEPASVGSNDGWDGAWYDEGSPGQGFLVDVKTNPGAEDFIFLAWFTYGDQANSGQRWLTAQGPFAGSGAEIPVYESTGGRFDDPQSVTTTSVGSLIIDFLDCSNAQISYNLDEGSVQGSIDLVRAVPGTESFCEGLD